MRRDQAGRSQSAFITRDEVRKILGVTQGKLRRMQDSGAVAFFKDERGVCRFAREQIERLAVERGRVRAVTQGVIAAKAFTMFAQGKPWQEIVIALEQTPEVVLRLLEQFHGEGVGGGRANDREVTHDDGGDSIESWQREQSDALQRAYQEFAREQREWEASRRSRGFGSRTRSEPARTITELDTPDDDIGFDAIRLGRGASSR